MLISRMFYRFLLPFSYLLFISSIAQAQMIGAWTTGITKDREALFAVTLNESEHLLGQYCLPNAGGCFWMVSTNTSCEEGQVYPVLVNADFKASHISLVCRSQFEKGKFGYFFQKFDEIDEVVSKSQRIGIAFPLESGQFRVIRFDLNGSGQAISLMKDAAMKLREQAAKVSTRDQLY